MKFSEEVINLSLSFPRNDTNQILVKQLLRSATSIGANYREACEAESSKDFVHKIKVAKKEARESEYWLQLLVMANPKQRDRLQELESMSNEFVRIFSTIVSRFSK